MLLLLVRVVIWHLLAFPSRGALETPAEASDFSTIPQYHLPMLNDLDRNTAYKLAIQKTVVINQSVVLDVGAGTGLLSLYAAAAGAKEVISVEHNELLYDIGNTIVHDNHYQDKIAFYHLDSSDITSSLPYEACLKLEKQRNIDNGNECDENLSVDLVITELFDSWILGEFILTVLGDLYDNKVIDVHTKVIPSQGNLFIQLVQSSFSFQSISPPNIDGFDYSAYHHYNLYTFNEITVTASQDITKHVSNVVNVFNFSFEPNAAMAIATSNNEGNTGYVNPYYHQRYEHVIFHINETAVTHGLLFWFNLWMDRDQTVMLSNEPHATKSHWKQMFLPFKKDFMAFKDTYFSVQIAHLPRRYVVLANHSKQRLIKIVSKCDVSQNDGIEVYTRHSISNGKGKGKGTGVVEETSILMDEDSEDLIDMNCFDDVGHPILRKRDCLGAKLKAQRHSKSEKSRRNNVEDLVEEQLIFSMDGAFNELNYWKGYIGQEFVAVIKLPANKRHRSRQTVIKRSFTVPSDNYQYGPDCTTKDSCGINNVELKVFNIYCNSEHSESRKVRSHLEL